jgi:hypothetical protein
VENDKRFLQVKSLLVGAGGHGGTKFANEAIRHAGPGNENWQNLHIIVGRCKNCAIGCSKANWDVVITYTVKGRPTKFMLIVNQKQHQEWKELKLRIASMLHHHC